MDYTVKIDQNRIDQCVDLINDGFVHIGTILFHYDIYYSPESDYTYEVGFPNDFREYKLYGYVGKYKYKGEGFPK